MAYYALMTNVQDVINNRLFDDFFKQLQSLQKFHHTHSTPPPFSLSPDDALFFCKLCIKHAFITIHLYSVLSGIFPRSSSQH